VTPPLPARQDLRTLTDITRELVCADDGQRLQLLVRQTEAVTDADIVSVVLADPDGRLTLETASRNRSDGRPGFGYEVADTLVGSAVATGRMVVVDDITQRADDTVHLTHFLSVGPVLVLPWRDECRTRGALVVARSRARHPFGATELGFARTMADLIALAVELADARAGQQRLELLENRDRVARELHDYVIQRLFAVGLGVQGIAAGLEGDARGERLVRSVGEIDETIRRIRASVFREEIDAELA
jgi:signal transduction histidine kinase